MLCSFIEIYTNKQSYILLTVARITDSSLQLNCVTPVHQQQSYLYEWHKERHRDKLIGRPMTHWSRAQCRFCRRLLCLYLPQRPLIRWMLT